MANAGLYGHHHLDTDSVNENVKGIGPGCYVLGCINQENNNFMVNYVGRSDNDLNDRLNQWCREKTKYTHFKYAFFDAAEKAFRKECSIYHDFGGPENRMDNDIHPAATNKDWKCLVCER